MVEILEKLEEKIKELLPLYFELISEYIRTGKRLSENLNPIYVIPKAIDDMEIQEKEELIENVESIIKELNCLLKSKSNHCCLQAV